MLSLTCCHWTTLVNFLLFSPRWPDVPLLKAGWIGSIWICGSTSATFTALALCLSQQSTVPMETLQQFILLGCLDSLENCTLVWNRALFRPNRILLEDGIFKPARDFIEDHHQLDLFLKWFTSSWAEGSMSIHAVGAIGAYPTEKPSFLTHTTSIQEA